mmetsp:Transcript_86441/g.249402  ORF Transcript_86441/g.249402 Transcript_86441/m.249402 type:complete len:598 (+) Transcript_86441:175-1968(+)
MSGRPRMPAGDASHVYHVHASHGLRCLGPSDDLARRSRHLRDALVLRQNLRMCLLHKAAQPGDVQSNATRGLWSRLCLRLARLVGPHGGHRTLHLLQQEVQLAGARVPAGALWQRLRPQGVRLVGLHGSHVDLHRLDVVHDEYDERVLILSSQLVELVDKLGVIDVARTVFVQNVKDCSKVLSVDVNRSQSGGEVLVGVVTLQQLFEGEAAAMILVHGITHLYELAPGFLQLLLLLLCLLSDEGCLIVSVCLLRLLDDDRQDQVDDKQIDRHHDGQEEQHRPRRLLDDRQRDQAPAVARDDLLDEGQAGMSNRGVSPAATIAIVPWYPLNDRLDELHRGEREDDHETAQQHNAPEHSPQRAGKAHDHNVQLREDLDDTVSRGQPNKTQQSQHRKSRCPPEDPRQDVEGQVDADSDRIDQVPSVPEEVQSEHIYAQAKLQRKHREDEEPEKSDPRGGVDARGRRVALHDGDGEGEKDHDAQGELNGIGVQSEADPSPGGRQSLQERRPQVRRFQGVPSPIALRRVFERLYEFGDLPLGRSWSDDGLLCRARSRAQAQTGRRPREVLLNHGRRCRLKAAQRDSSHRAARLAKRCAGNKI